MHTGPQNDTLAHSRQPQSCGTLAVMAVGGHGTWGRQLCPLQAEP